MVQLMRGNLLRNVNSVTCHYGPKADTTNAHCILKWLRLLGYSPWAETAKWWALVLSCLYHWLHVWSAAAPQAFLPVAKPPESFTWNLPWEFLLLWWCEAHTAQPHRYGFRTSLSQSPTTAWLPIKDRAAFFLFFLHIGWYDQILIISGAEVQIHCRSTRSLEWVQGRRWTCVCGDGGSKWHRALLEYGWCRQ